jgi:hypothetical protein
MNIEKHIPQIIPILLIFAYFVSPGYIVPFSYTMFGRLLVILVVIYYACIDLKTALVLTAFVIYHYYQSDHKFLHEKSEGFLWELTLNGSEIPYVSPKPAIEEENKEENDKMDVDKVDEPKNVD